MDKNAVKAILASSVRQGTEGDSPEAQKKQIERFADSKGFTIRKFFVFLEYANQASQSVVKLYCRA